LTCYRINPGDIRPLVPIASVAREREIVRHGLAVMLAGDNVISDVPNSNSGLRELTILTATTSPPANFVL
jgi:hypothetical protein